MVCIFIVHKAHNSTHNIGVDSCLLCHYSYDKNIEALVEQKII